MWKFFINLPTSKNYKQGVTFVQFMESYTDLTWNFRKDDTMVTQINLDSRATGAGTSINISISTSNGEYVARICGIFAVYWRLEVLVRKQLVTLMNRKNIFRQAKRSAQSPRVCMNEPSLTFETIYLGRKIFSKTLIIADKITIRAAFKKQWEF